MGAFPAQKADKCTGRSSVDLSPDWSPSMGAPCRMTARPSLPAVSTLITTLSQPYLRLKAAASLQSYSSVESLDTITHHTASESSVDTLAVGSAETSVAKEGLWRCQGCRALPEALGMQRSKDACRGDRSDAEDARPARAHDQQHHNRQLRPWRASCSRNAHHEHWRHRCACAAWRAGPT